ncbi:MAG: transcriptional regulator NrdR [Spirochaetia bacterium]
MRCPHCGKAEDKVLESRQNTEGDTIRRRRECLACGYRFTSYEHIEKKKLMVVKRSGGREPFDTEKIERGILRALENRTVPRPIIEEMLHAIEDECNGIGRVTHEVSASKVGELVLKQLYKIDKVAYIRFASVYRKFENVEEFIREIEKLSG